MIQADRVKLLAKGVPRRGDYILYWMQASQDPNGFTGVAWCFGLHDRPWPERRVFGQVRAMTESGLRRKFDVDRYVRNVGELSSPGRR